LPALSTNSTRRIVQGATHETLVAHEEHAHAVADAIREVIESTRTGHPLE
jgi:hypothetical protein